jgi:hypothetical protein
LENVLRFGSICVSIRVRCSFTVLVLGDGIEDYRHVPANLPVLPPL